MSCVCQVRFRNVADVARWRLCVGCGACAYVCEKKNIVLEDVPAHGIRPTIPGTGCEECGRCLDVCPGLGVAHNSCRGNEYLLKELHKGWGPILEMWEGHAADPEIRYLGSSGGVATAIALYCLETGHAGGVVHVGKNQNEPWRNKTVLSTTRKGLLSRTGARYSPASPCEYLEKIESAFSHCVFMGKPCDIQGIRKAEALKPPLREKGTLTIGIFCAGTPATAGVLALLGRLQATPEAIDEIRFRGNGWPGSFVVQLKGQDKFSHKLSYQESWGFLQAYRPFRCYLCPDGTSEFADISCGDPWYREIKDGEPGYSLVLVRTEKGKEILEGALKAGYVTLGRARPEILEASQRNLLKKRSEIWGRLFAMRMFGLPTPQYPGFPLYENWKKLLHKEKVRSILGTIRRIIQRKYYHPLKYNFKT